MLCLPAAKSEPTLVTNDALFLSVLLNDAVNCCHLVDTVGERRVKEEYGGGLVK
jgi:hypothetical protein